MPSLVIGKLFEVFFPRGRVVIACAQVSGGLGASEFEDVRGGIGG